MAAGHIRVKHLFQPFKTFNRCAPFKSLKLTESVSGEDVGDAVSQLDKVRLSQKLFTYRAGADKMRQQAKGPYLVSDATSNDGRMNAEALRQFHDSQRCLVVFYLARIPYVFWNERILGPFIRFGFSRITSRDWYVTKTQIIDEYFVFRVAHMAADVSKLVQQTELSVHKSLFTVLCPSRLPATP